MLVFQSFYVSFSRIKEKLQEYSRKRFHLGDNKKKAIVENGEKTKKYCKNMGEICIKAFQKK